MSYAKLAGLKLIYKLCKITELRVVDEFSGGKCYFDTVFTLTPV